MSSSSGEQRLAFAVLEWLESRSRQRPSDESLLVASQCLSEYFGLSLDDGDQRARLGGTRPLREVFEAGCAALGSHGTTERYESVRNGMDDDLLEFVSRARAKGYFEGCEPESLEFKSRYVKVVDKYLEKRRPLLMVSELTTEEPSPQAEGGGGEDEVAKAIAVIARALDETEIADAATKLFKKKSNNNRR